MNFEANIKWNYKCFIGPSKTASLRRRLNVEDIILKIKSSMPFQNILMVLIALALSGLALAKPEIGNKIPPLIEETTMGQSLEPCTSLERCFSRFKTFNELGEHDRALALLTQFHTFELHEHQLAMLKAWRAKTLFLKGSQTRIKDPLFWMQMKRLSIEAVDMGYSNDTELWRMLAQADLWFLENPKNAEVWIKEGLSLDQDNPELLSLTVVVEVYQSKFQQARHSFQRAYEANPDVLAEKVTMDAIIQAYLGLGYIQGAANLLGEFKKRNPRDFEGERFQAYAQEVLWLLQEQKHSQ